MPWPGYIPYILDALFVRWMGWNRVQIIDPAKRRLRIQTANRRDIVPIAMKVYCDAGIKRQMTLQGSLIICSTLPRSVCPRESRERLSGGIIDLSQRGNAVES